ncbi:hypothetical protein AB0O91_21930 [Kitasatospora sp. NPDC089797]|uniref:hypothetical protein n=1 Tax=Kitasatospora sp. NPDC089797 TaxID=3155298 RepID=UPI00343235B6
MTGPWETFDGIVPEIQHEGLAFHAAFNEARQAARHVGESTDVREYGRWAWQQLTPVQRAYALDSLFSAYFRRIHEEETQLRHRADTEAGRTYLHPDDLVTLSESLLYQDGDGEGATVTTLASSLSNVLAELELLRYQLCQAHAVAEDE